jgi:predicted dinucleotide-binding enzyme
MQIAIVGPGRIGGNVARLAVRAGHDVTLTFARDQAKLAAFAGSLGEHAAVAERPAAAVTDADLIVLSVPWGEVPDALEQLGPLDGKIVVDTTNQYSGGRSLDLSPETAARHNARRMPGVRYTKCFNTLTAQFQAEAADRTGDERIVQWICGDDADAKQTVAQLVRDAHYIPVDIGGADDATVMEAPRRDGAVYGEEYRQVDAGAVVDAVRAGRPIPPTPVYSQPAG